MSDHDAYLMRLFTAAANLYGEISMHELWDICLQLRQKGMEKEKIHKSDLLAFSEKIKTEKDLPFLMKEEDELYEAEKRDPDDLHILHPALQDQGKLDDYYDVHELRHAFEPHIPETFWDYGDGKQPEVYTKLKDWLDERKISDGPFTDADGISYTPAFPGMKLKDIHKRSPQEIEDEVPEDDEKMSASERIMQKIWLSTEVGKDPVGFITSDAVKTLESHGCHLTSNDVNHLTKFLFDLFLQLPAWCLNGNTMEAFLQELAREGDPRFTAIYRKDAASYLCADIFVHPYDTNETESSEEE